MKAKQIGRPSKFTPEVRQRVLWSLRRHLGAHAL
jgi:hypothetical protein